MSCMLVTPRDTVVEGNDSVTTTSGGKELSGGAPFEGSIWLSPSSSCQLTMWDDFEDGWSGIYWHGALA